MTTVTVKKHTRKTSSGKTVEVRRHERDTKVIYFPKAEQDSLAKRLDAGKDIYTTRISAERGLYNKGQSYESPVGALSVVNVKSYKRLSSHPFLSELTKEQKAAIEGHRFDLVRLRREDAPGIPSRDRFITLPEVTSPQHWDMAIQTHKAEKRGEHLDLRLGRGDDAFSWALSSWPEPGKHGWAIEQPTHTREYMDFEGTIPSGYGAGTVSTKRKGPIMVHYASPNAIKLTAIDGKKTEDIALIRIKDRIWRAVNFSAPPNAIAEFQHKPKYKVKQVAKLDPNDGTRVWSAKIDGAHGILKLQGNRRPRVFSYRVPKAGGTIEWTHKIPELFNLKVPASLKDTVLRVEVSGKEGKGYLRPESVAGLLNANVLTSLEKQKTNKTTLQPYLIDVIRYKGEDMAKASGAEKLKVLREVAKLMPYFELPDMAETPEDKISMLNKIKAKSHHQTDEGIVEIPLGQEPFTKGKILEETDVYVRGFFEAKEGSKYDGNAIGGFTYSYTPGGPVAGRVGTGLTDSMRQEMYQKPQKYLGAIAMVRGQKFKSGAQRVPAFVGWHPDFATVLDIHHDLKPPKRSK